jgi:hypothetical protein
MKKLILCFFVTLIISIAGYSQTATVTAENANLRGTPSKAGKVINEVSRNISLEVIRQKGAWFLVQTPDYVGWIHGNTIKLTGTGIETETTSVPNPLSLVTGRTTSAPTTVAKTRPTMRTFIRGPRGGCYYLNSNERKTYVDRSLCN